MSTRLDLHHISNVDDIFEAFLKTSEETIIASKNPIVVEQVETIVNVWCKNIEKVLALSKQIVRAHHRIGFF